MYHPPWSIPGRITAPNLHPSLTPSRMLLGKTSVTIADEADEFDVKVKPNGRNKRSSGPHHSCRAERAVRWASATRVLAMRQDPRRVDPL